MIHNISQINEILIFKLSTVSDYDGTAKTYEELKHKIIYYALLNVRTYDGTTEQNSAIETVFPLMFEQSKNGLLEGVKIDT